GGVLGGARITPGDVIIGLPSSGLHTNGYSLARKLFFDTAGLSTDSRVDELDATVGEELLRVHRSYLRCLERPLREDWIEGLAHITGGGIPGNLPRILPEGTAARIVRGSWPVPPVFTWLQREGRVDQEEMDRAFNMGIGMIAVVEPADARKLERHLDSEGEAWHRIGSIEPGDGGVRYE
ncbi:MAG: AIR synthase-related protein, partial [Acidobacteriota bacterium]|nr:AIR synthase-related protein [Acidobacteriota bacterium]